jgi:hypothetical protein
MSVVQGRKEYADVPVASVNRLGPLAVVPAPVASWQRPVPEGHPKLRLAPDAAVRRLPGLSFRGSAPARGQPALGRADGRNHYYYPATNQLRTSYEPATNHFEPVLSTSSY